MATIYGENLTNSDGSAAGLGFWPNGQVSFDNVTVVNSGQLSATYSIDSSVSAVLGAITAQTDGGTAMGPDFEIDAAPAQAPQATVNIDPANWQAGWTNQPVTISGSNWGGSPSASVDVSDITLNVSPDSSGNLSGTVTIPSTETATQVDVTVSFGSGCTGNCYTSTGQQSTGTPNPATGSASITAAPSPTPTLSLSQPLWFFGSGVTPSSQFTLGGVQSVVTASGVTGGSYSWTITSGTDVVSFSSSGQQSTSTANGNSVTIYSINATSTSNDATIQVSWTPSGGGNASTATLDVNVDFPYELSPYSTDNSGIGYPPGCSPNFTSGSLGYYSLIAYEVLSYNGVLMPNVDLNENLVSRVDDYPGNDWISSQPSGASTDSAGILRDALCALNPNGTPRSLPPGAQRTIPVYHQTQTWFIGSQTVGSGVGVQTDTMQKYRDHGAHNNIVSPM
jgi:hypothetical protein